MGWFERRRHVFDEEKSAVMTRPLEGGRFLGIFSFCDSFFPFFILVCLSPHLDSRRSGPATASDDLVSLTS